MDLINSVVIHKVFGEGIIINHEHSYLTVKFQQGEKKFVFPNAFDGYLTTEDNMIAEKIKQELENIKIAKKEERERLIELVQQEQSITGGKHSKVKKKVFSRVNIAFKCNFCNGGQSDEQIGFHGVCSDDVIYNNIEVEKRTWCSAAESACRQYLEGEKSRSELDALCNNGGFVCYESQMLGDWRALAGVVQTGEKKGQPMKLNKVQNNSLCVLTTRDPNSKERERYIFGVFLVDETYGGDNREAGYVTTDSRYRIKLSPKEAHKMLFWNYHANNNRPEKIIWSSGLHRYFDDEQAIQILQDIEKIKHGTKDQELASEFLVYFAQINNIDISNILEKNGALYRK